jgi:hypothetical protein
LDACFCVGRWFLTERMQRRRQFKSETSTSVGPELCGVSGHVQSGNGYHRQHPTAGGGAASSYKCDSGSAARPEPEQQHGRCEWNADDRERRDKLFNYGIERSRKRDHNSFHHRESRSSGDFGLRH